MAEWYADYLQGEHWLTLRDRIFYKRGRTCEDCGWDEDWQDDFRYTNQGPLNLHHVTYARLGHERLADLRILCARCHYRAHKTHDVPYLFLIYREDYDANVAPILAGSRGDSPFQYPRYRSGKQPKGVTT